MELLALSNGRGCEIVANLQCVNEVGNPSWPLVPFVAEWSKAPEFDAETGGESQVQAPVWAVTFSPYV